MKFRTHECEKCHVRFARRNGTMWFTGNSRFRGWGGEDVAFLRSVDTLYGKHRNTDNDVLHLWHPQFVTDTTVANWKVRVWEGQTSPRANDKLATRYHKANGNPEAMQALVDGR